MKSVRLIVFTLLGIIGTSCIAQTTPDMATGLSPYATYIPSEIDNINPANGNIFVKIPLLGYPQKGGRLRLNYYIYYNDKQWQANLAQILPTYGSSYVTGQWTPAGISPSGGSTLVPSPTGAYIARDQFLGFGTNYNQTKVENVGGLGGDSIIESTSYLTKYVYTPDGSIHYTGDGVNEIVACGPTVAGGSCPATPGWGNGSFLNTYPATDGSGYDQLGHDPEGNAYTSSSVTDPNGNTITQSSTGWKDTFDRSIPGGTTGAGANEFPNATSAYSPKTFFDLVPGTELSSVPYECPTGTSAAREWKVPGSTSNGGSATYYLCYTYLGFQSAFNTGANLLQGNQVGSVPEGGSASGLGQALLLTAIVLPDLNSYTFQYDSYLSLTQIKLPSGGTINYTWQNIAFRPLPDISTSWAGIATPISRALATRTVNPGNGQPAITTTYRWNINENATYTGAGWRQGVTFPVYSIVTDGNGNDTEYTLGGTDEYGVMWADYVVTGVATYSGCGPHNLTCSSSNPNPLRSATYGLTASTSGGAPQVSPAYVPLLGTFPPTKVTQETTHLQTSSGNYILSRVKSFLTPMYGTCTVYSYPKYSTPGSQPFSSNQYTSCYATSQISSTATYDWGMPGSGSAGPLLKTETKTFVWEQPYVSSVPAFFSTGSTVYSLSTVPNSANMLNLVDTDVITDGSGMWMAETNYCYDGNGNNTSVQRFPTQPSSHSCSSPPSNALVTSTTYSQGVVTSSTDARQNATVMSNFACNGALPQNVTLPDGNHVGYMYDCNTGKVTSVQDQNNINNSVATNYTYADPLNRVTKAVYPEGGSVTVDYHGDSLPLTMTVTKATGESAGPNVTTKIYDGLARIIHVPTSDGLPGVEDTLYSDTNYDSLGRTYSVSNPYRATSDGTYGLTTTSYDALSRKTQVTNPDGTYQRLSYNGNVVTFTDESGNQWQRTSDALGRLTKVLEPSSTSQTPTLSTNNVYDALGNLKSVTQVGISGSEAARNRSFAYDALSRLVAATNPEKSSSSGPSQSCSGASGNWTNCYSFDANGNVSQEKDNRGISISYSYDSMNRLYGKSYSSGDPSACYQYNVPITGAPDQNSKGYMTLEWTQSGSCPGPSNPQTSIPSGAITSTAILQHDPMGRIQQEQVCPLGVCSTPYRFNYGYDLAGNLTSSNNGLPSTGSSTTAPAISWGEMYDAANHVSLVSVTGQPWSDSAHPPVLFQANQNTYSTFGSKMPYDPFGHLVEEQLGLSTSSASSISAINTERTYNKMGRILTKTDSQNTLQSPPTNSTGSISIGPGPEKSITLPSSSATVTININGSEHSATFYSCPMQYGGCPVTVYDGGSYSINVNGVSAGGFGWSQGATPGGLASSLASSINGNSNSPVTATYSGASVTLTSKIPGTAGNYGVSVTMSWSSNAYFSSPSFTVSAPSPMSGGANGATVYDTGTVTVTVSQPASFATATVGVSGSEQSYTFNPCPPNVSPCPQTIYDGGGYTIYVNGVAAGGIGWGQGATSDGLASNLASSINANSNSPVTATASRSLVTLTSKVAGTAGDYGISLASSWGSSYFSSPSFAVSAPSSMSITTTINTVASASWNSGSNSSNLASSLATQLQNVAGSFLNAAASGSTITLTSVGTGPSTNYTVSVTTTDTQTAYFSSPSFTASGSSMTGGSSGVSLTTPFYSYQVPASGGYTANGNIAAINDSVTGNWTYGYDSLNRLQTATASSGTYAGQHGCWAYDSFGNRTAESFGSPACPSSETSVPATASYNANNQLSGTQYDPAGNVSGDALNLYRYDGEGRLCAVKNSNQSVYQYVYDAEGRRVAKATLTGWPAACYAPSSSPGFAAQLLYLRGSSGMQTTELTGAGVWVHTNYFGSGAPMATWSSSGSWPFAFHITDQLGSRRVLADAHGAVLENCQNLPYGNGETCAPTPTEHLFTGKERDTESTNDYFEARYYSFNTGRFLSPDWSAKVEPVPYATMADPQSLNLYAYVHNNPITGMDPDGHMSNSDFSQMMMLGIAAQGAAWQQQQAQQQKPKTMNQVAMSAERAALKLTKGDFHEYYGVILQNEADGQYSSTKPRQGTEGVSDPDSIPVPKGFKVVGEYHTHPHNSPSDVPGPSPGDIYRLRTPELASRIGYVADSYTGQVYRYTQSEPVKGPFDLGVYGTKIGTIP